MRGSHALPPPRPLLQEIFKRVRDDGRVRILLVEDEKRLVAALKRGLEAEGYSVDVALDGRIGLWMATENSYDAVVLDVLLPEMNGYEVCRHLRESGNAAPIMMLTAKYGELDEAEALDMGADDFLSKPFSYRVLVARLSAMVHRVKSEIEASVN